MAYPPKSGGERRRTSGTKWRWVMLKPAEHVNGISGGPKYQIPTDQNITAYLSDIVVVLNTLKLKSHVK